MATTVPASAGTEPGTTAAPDDGLPLDVEMVAGSVDGGRSDRPPG